MQNLLFKHQKLTSFILGSLSVLALPPFYVFPILLLTSSLLLLLMDGKKSFINGYCFGFGFFSFGLSWVGNALLIDAATFGWLYVLTFFGAGAFFGLFIAFPALLAGRFKNLAARALAFSAYVVIFEWLRSFVLTGFPWNLWGSTLAFSPLALQLASLIGTYGLSLLVILFSCTPALFLKGFKKTALGLSLGILCLALGFGFYRLNELKDDETSSTRIRIVQPSIPQAMKWNRETLENNFQQYISLSKAPGLEDIDLVIWGETASPFILDMDQEHLAEITQAVPKNGFLITGVVRYEFDQKGDYQPLNSMFVINKRGEIVNYYDKSHLVPFGEYIPLRSLMPSWIKPVTNTIANFKQGEGRKNISLPNLPSFSALICYEIIFPSQVIDKKDSPEWLINLTNDGWYGDSAGPRQHLVATQLRAIEEGITIVRVANSGISAIISKTGQVLGTIPLNIIGNLDVSLPKKLFVVTLYRQFGSTIPLIFCLANILIAFFISKKHL